MMVEELSICGLDGFLMNAQMRCFQVSKGGVKYELIVSPANYSKSTRRSLPVARSTTSLSLVDIQRKQDEAAIRRINQRSSRIPSQHLHHIVKVRENKRKSINDFRSAIKKETEQKMWNSEIARENRMKSVQVKNRSEHVKTHVSHLNEAAVKDIKNLEEHLKMQKQHLKELRFQTDDLIQAIKDWKLL